MLTCYGSALLDAIDLVSDNDNPEDIEQTFKSVLEISKYVLALRPYNLADMSCSKATRQKIADFMASLKAEEGKKYVDLY